ncbi:uncharacterized protein N7458_012701 [Penicillium daleae]|uniref:NWD NACHT-NTPase N-terminal domain-containing protein n=1 Tax=Penicillium daleae TaxID=63821 RepID=A0AAD6FYK5_9EURO|nr:uncharacterized protein N7458_012701 [Penicillium daleae]KAJ5433545.1 hypothetical protein N7458_012701 [Penicillium daleae]
MRFLARKEKKTGGSKRCGRFYPLDVGPSACGPVESSLIMPTTIRPADQIMPSSPLSSNATPTLLGPSTRSTASNLAYLHTSDDFELWTRAYQILQSREPELTEDYIKHLASLQSNGSSDADLSTSQCVETIVKQLLENWEKKQWRVSLLGKEIKIRQQAERLVKFLLWAEPIVKSAVSTQPYAALAWSGVSLLLPLLTSGTTKNEAMLKDFNSIDDVQVYWRICEKTYLRSSHRHRYQDLIEPLAKLYSHIVEYQARVICHLSSAQLSRAWQNVAGWNDWDGKAAEIDYLSKKCGDCITPLEAEEIRKNRDSQLKEMQESRTILDEIRTILEVDSKQTQRNYEDQKERVLLQDLASDYEDYKNFNPPRVQGTCEWFLRDEIFRKWRDSDTSSLLWVSADPGCGKSVLSRALIDERRLSTKVTTSTVCYFFFKDGDDGHMYATDALCAILHQLFTHDLDNRLVEHALPSHRNYGKGLAQNFAELWRILVNCAGSLDAGEIVCVLDALDECNIDGRRQLIDKLKEFYCQPRHSSKSLSKLKFLITSRPYDDLEASFKKFSGITAYMRFDGDEKSAEINNEVNLVIDAKMHEIARDFKEDDRLTISHRLKSMNHRTYLWLRLTFDIIEQNPSIYGRPCDVETLLSDLPYEVSEAYEKILGRSRNQTYTEALLQIVLAAARPLTLDEANIVLTLALQKRRFTSHDALERNLWPRNTFKSTVKSLCGLFLSIYDSKLSFIHHTAREFLIHPRSEGKWKGRLNMSKSHSKMSSVCLTYLSYLGEQSPIGEIKAKHPLAQYSFRHLMDHARLAGPVEDIQENIFNFFVERRKAYAVWGILFDPDRPWSEEPNSAEVMAAPLYYASLAGLQRTVELLLKEGADVNAQGGRFGNAVQAASYHGYKGVVRLLLEEGANVNTQGGDYGNSLYAAALQGHKGVVQLLLEKGANVNAQGGFFGDALGAASLQGDKEVVRLLLEQGADVNFQGGRCGNALQAASYQGGKEVVQLLLQQGADVNVQGGRYGNALQAASYKGDKEVVQLLLQQGADVNARGGRFGNALQAASFHGRKEIIQLLLEQGASVNAQGGRFGNAVQAASFNGHMEVVRLLLEQGADVTAQGGRFGNAVQAASLQGHSEIVQLLLERGANVNAQGGYFSSALQAASVQGAKEVAQLLLDQGADVNAQGGFFGNALQAASYQGGKEVVQLLLQQGADVNVQGGRYGNALQAASYKGDREVVQLLLQQGADANAQGGFFGNVLKAASLQGDKEVVRLLLEQGADVTAQVRDNGNAPQAVSTGPAHGGGSNGG